MPFRYSAEVKTPKRIYSPTSENVPELVSAKTLSSRFQLTKRGIAGLAIPKVKIGRRAIRYRLSDVLEFIERRTIYSSGAISHTANVEGRGDV
jgi:predicted DNA-binding transcriptional regulator AlpA